MKLSLIVEILVLCALVAFATARVIDSRSYENQEFTSRLLSNVSAGVTNQNQKLRQNEITVGGPDYDDVVGSSEIVVGEDDLISNNVSSEAAATSSAAAVSHEENNDVALPTDDNTEAPVNIDDAHPLNRYCTCNEAECNCCREFKLPLVSVRGPGCASLRYLGKNRMTIAIKYGDITLTSRTISGRKARPVCLNLPGGYSQFCGRVYGISRESDDFQACLGLELRAEEEVEAALRVSCFKFGPKGLKMTDAQPLPPVTDVDDDDDDDSAGGLLGLVTGAGDSDEEEYDEDEDEEEDEEATGQDATTGDDDADLIGFADEDEDDEEDEDGDDDGDDLDDDDDDDDDEVAPAGGDYPTGFSLLDGLFGDSPNKKKKPVQTRNKAEDVKEAVKETIKEVVKETTVGAKVKIPNSPAILNSASLSQNEIDNNIPKDTVSAFDPVDLAPAVEAAVEAAAAATPLAEEKPKPSIITDLQSNAGVPLVSTTKKPKKKPSSFLDTIESLITGGDDDDDEDDDTKDDETEDDDDEEEEEVNDDDDEEEDDEEKDDEEKDEEEKDEEEKDEEEKDEKDEEEDEEEKEEDDEEVEEDEDKEEEDDDEEDQLTTTNDKEATADKTEKKTDKKTKKKNNYGLGFFARLMKFI